MFRTNATETTYFSCQISGVIKHFSSFVHLEFFTTIELKRFTLVLQLCVKTLWGIQISKEVEFYKTTRCKFNASQTSAVFLTCRVEFVAAVIMHVQLQSKIHGVLLKQFFFFWFLGLSFNGFVRFCLMIRDKQRAFAIQLLF